MSPPSNMYLEEELEQRYLKVYQELLVEMDRLFLLQNGSTMTPEIKSRSQLRAHHLLNLSKSATLLNLDPENSSKRIIDAKLLESFHRDGELNQYLDHHWNLLHEYVQLIQESCELRQKLIQIAHRFPKQSHNTDQTTLNYEILDSIYNVLLVQGGYQGKLDE